MLRNWAGIALILMGFILPPRASGQFLGQTFEDRKQAYINDQGNYWRQWFPAAMKQAVFAWLERPDLGDNRKLISEEIYYITSGTGRNGDRDCTGQFWWPWKNCWWTGDQPAPVVVSRIYYQYYQQKRVISDADAELIRSKLRNDIVETPGIWCAVPNYHIRYLVTAYLYTTRIEDIGEVLFPYPDDYGCPRPFSYNGHSYQNGNLYPASQIYGDLLNYILDEWLQEGTSEDITTSDYYYAQIHSLALLYDFARDPVLKQKAKMFLDWLVFNYAISFSAGHPSGGHGRNYTGLELSGQDFFPWGILFEIDSDLMRKITQRGTYTELYVSNYRVPQLLASFFEKLNGPNASVSDDFYRIIRGSVPALGTPWWHENRFSTGYRYDYITPNYNLGGTGLGTGWELNILSETTPFKLWMNPCEQNDQRGCNTQDGGREELLYLGTHGFQYRNAVFMNSPLRLHYDLGGGSWDETATRDEWQFFREKKVCVAVGITSDAAAVEVATLGVDYSSFAEFQQAILQNARLEPGRYVTSKGVTIAEGFIDFGRDFSSLPFDRLEVWEGHVGKNDEKKVVDWRNNVMTVQGNGQKMAYDFNNWTVLINGSSPPPPAPTPDRSAPAAPQNVRVQVRNDGN